MKFANKLFHQSDLVFIFFRHFHHYVWSNLNHSKSLSTWCKYHPRNIPG